MPLPSFRRPLRWLLPPLVAAATLLLRPGEARADRGPDAWPVRVNLALPIGDTFGSDRFHGFTWGLRAAVEAYPDEKARGVGFGPFGEVLWDAKTHSRWTLGGGVSTPLVSGDHVAWRIGALAGWTSSGDGTADGRTRSELTLGVGTHVAVPFYLYDFRLGVQLRTSVSSDGFSCTTALFDLDLVGLIGAVGIANGRR